METVDAGKKWQTVTFAVPFPNDEFVILASVQDVNAPGEFTTVRIDSVTTVRQAKLFLGAGKKVTDFFFYLGPLFMRNRAETGIGPIKNRSYKAKSHA